MMFEDELEEDVVATAEERDPALVLGSRGLEPMVVDMMRRFGGETAETALIQRILMFDGDFTLVWETQFLPKIAREDVPVLQWGLLSLFANDISWLEDDDFESDEHLFFRWQYATRLLLEVGEAAGATGPWLYGWAMLGVDLCSDARAARLQLRNKQLAEAFCEYLVDAESGIVSADELPVSLDEVRERGGVSDAVIARVEAQLIEMLLAPEPHLTAVDA